MSCQAAAQIGDMDHNKNPPKPTPSKHHNRMASCRQDATQSRSLRIRWAPIIGRPIAATSANIARTWNVTGVWDKGAENHNKRARISRATTATQRPRSAIKRRTNEVRMEGWITPYTDNRTMTRENIANAIAISITYLCGLTSIRRVKGISAFWSAHAVLIPQVALLCTSKP